MKIITRSIIYIVIIMSVLILSNNAPFLRAAGVGSGAADINARYLDGYGTSLATSSSKIYISDGSGYLPDGSVDTGAILDGTIMNADVNASAAIDVSKFSGLRALTSSASADITVTTSMCSSAPCDAYTIDYRLANCIKICTSQGYVGCDHYHYIGCGSPGWSAPKIWNPAGGVWSTGTACVNNDGWGGHDRLTEVTCYR
jgi:hypothetical protein